MRVPLLALKEQYATLKSDLQKALEEVLESQVLINGPAVAELEGRIAEVCACARAIGTSSGTDALLCALMALEIGSGDEVITTPYSFFATAGCVWRVGARPIFVDIEPDTFNLDPSRIESAVSERTKAIIPVHLFGQMAEMDPILEIARKHDLSVIEDAAQAIGAMQNGRKAGSLGTVGCLSFYPTKNLGGIGDGGMLVTNDLKLADRLAMLREHGARSNYYHRWVG
ncbi:MAG: DegT/DnrJ/EryC1/StrS family aminotransferase, partial [Planctomycetota bacterium]